MLSAGSAPTTSSPSGRSPGARPRVRTSRGRSAIRRSRRPARARAGGSDHGLPRDCSARISNAGMNNRRMKIASTRSRRTCTASCRASGARGEPAGRRTATRSTPSREGRREPHLELVAIGVGDERFAGRAAGRDPVHLASCGGCRRRGRSRAAANVVLLEERDARRGRRGTACPRAGCRPGSCASR